MRSAVAAALVIATVVVACGDTSSEVTPPPTSSTSVEPANAAPMQSDPDVAARVAWARNLVNAADLRGPGTVLQPGVASSFLKGVDGRITPRLRRAARAEQRAAIASFPAKATEFVLINDDTTVEATEFGIGVRIQGATAASAGVGAGYVVYEKAATGRTVLFRPTSEGAEDFIAYETEPTDKRVRYEVTLGPQVAGLRLVARTLEFLDARGVPRLRMNPPYIVGNNGKALWAQVALQGCAADTSAALPYGRAVTAPGAAQCTVEITWPTTGVAYPAVLDPSWVSTGSLAVAREKHGMLALTGGGLLAFGGADLSGPTASTERFNEETSTWSTSTVMPVALSDVRAVKLTDGRFLCAGGTPASGVPSAAAVIYEPVTQAWTSTGSMATARTLHALARLPSGKVLAVGGLNTSGVPIASAEAYDPATGLWSGRASVPTARSMLVPGTVGGHVVVTGGFDGTTVSDAFDTFDEATNTWSTQAMLMARSDHAVAETADGKLAIIGGRDAAGATLRFIDVYDPAAPWMSLGLPGGRALHTATKLPDGTVAIVGGTSDYSNRLSDVHVLDAVAGSVTHVADIDPAAVFHAATVTGRGTLELPHLS